MSFDVEAARAGFPILDQSIGGAPLVYLDSAATTQKPRVVLEAVRRYYEADNANVHRGVHTLSERATALLEGAREKARRFVGAESASEIVFVRGATEAINLVAHSFGAARVRAGDNIVVTVLEHHSNLVPWQLLCARSGASLRVVPVDDGGELTLEALAKLIDARTRLVAVAQVSNALGTTNDLHAITALAHEKRVPVLVDGAQAAAHLPIDVCALGCDLYVLSGHKMYAPMGSGILWAKRELLEEMPPWQSGGEMVSEVSLESASWQPPPHKFEAGTPDVGAAVGLGAAIDYLESLDRASVLAHEDDLLRRLREGIARIPKARLLGNPRHPCAVASFSLGEHHPHDVGAALDARGIAVRTGHLCAQPLLARFGLKAVVRASIALYNRAEEIDAFLAALAEVDAVLRGSA